MTSERYATLIALKSALDSAYKRRDPLSIVEQDYDITLLKTKTAGFRVMRNSAGEHKLIDKADSEGMAKVYETLASMVK